MKKRIVLESFRVLPFDGIEIKQAPMRAMNSPHPKSERRLARTPDSAPPAEARSLVDFSKENRTEAAGHGSRQGQPVRKLFRLGRWPSPAPHQPQPGAG